MAQLNRPWTREAIVSIMKQSRHDFYLQCFEEVTIILLAMGPLFPLRSMTQV